jgi:hypothetical protein
MTTQAPRSATPRDIGLHDHRQADEHKEQARDNDDFDHDLAEH